VFVGIGLCAEVVKQGSLVCAKIDVKSYYKSELWNLDLAIWGVGAFRRSWMAELAMAADSVISYLLTHLAKLFYELQQTLHQEQANCLAHSAV
jgi:hypothetical protein